MFVRFTHRSREITVAGLSRIVQSGPVRWLLLGLVAWLSLGHGRAAIEALHPFSVGGGRLLSQLAVGADLGSLPGCHGASCTVETVAPSPSPPHAVPVRWLPEPVLRLPWPARLHYPDSFAAFETREWVAQLRERHPGVEEFVWRLPFGSNAGGLHYAMVDVPSGGYVARLLFPPGSGVAPLTFEAHGADASRRQVLLERNGERLRRWRTEGGGRPFDSDAPLPEGLLEKDPLAIAISPEALEFQPVAMPMRMQLPPESVGRVWAGDPVTIRFEAPDRHAPPFDVAGTVTAVRAEQVQVESTERVDRWLPAYAVQADARSPATDRVTLLVRESLGEAAGRAVRVPASAVVARAAAAAARDGAPAADEATVWVIAEGTAVPVRVRVGRTVGDRVVVNEVRSALSGSIHPEDWRAMPLERRAWVYQLLAPGQGREPGLLLHAQTQVVVRPDPGLRAGDPLRSR